MTKNHIASCFVLIVAVLVLSGCSSQDFGAPIGGKLTDLVDSRKPYVNDEADNRAALLRSQKLAKALAEWKLDGGPAAPEYHVGPDDVLTLEILALEEPGKVSSLLRTVKNDGNINLLFGGKVIAEGMTTSQIEAEVKKSLGGRYIKNPQVTVSVSQYRSAAVIITGAVNKPDVYYLTRDSRTVLEMLAEADGLAGNAGDELLLIRGGRGRKNDSGDIKKQGNVISVDLKKLVDDGEVRLNLPVYGGDMLTVQPRLKTYIYVLGYVNRPGSYELRDQESIDAIKAVALAGGLTTSGRAENSFLLRKTDEGQQVVEVDLTKTFRGVRPPVMMKSGDTLVVGSSVLARLSEFFNIRAGASASYAPGP